MGLLIKNGWIVDGSGGPRYKGHLLIKEDKIEDIMIGHSGEEDIKVIDAEGLIVAPGFIDTHSHSELWILEEPLAEAKIRQGITTEITGHCGLTPAPLWGEGGAEFMLYSQYLLGDISRPWGWKKTEDFLKILEENSSSVNLGYLFGHNNLRASVIGGFIHRHANDDEIKKMRMVALEAMQAGVLGFSTGLGYCPGIWADQREILAILQVVGENNGIYATHIRNSGRYLLSSMEEAIDTAERAQVSLHIAHMKTIGKFNWGKIKASVELLDQAREKIPVTIDAYPYTSGTGYLQTLMPHSLFEGGPEKMYQSLQSIEVRRSVKKSIPYEVDLGKILVIAVGSKENEDLLNKTIAEISQNKKSEPIDTILDLLIEEKGRVLMVMEGMCEDDVMEVLSWPYCMIGTDGLPKVGPMCHPRTFGSFVRFLSKYCREEGLMSLEEAIRRITFLPAQTFGLRRRGFLGKGYFADLVLFNENELEELSQISKPLPSTKGIEYVFVNGELVLHKNVMTGQKPGVLLRREK